MRTTARAQGAPAAGVLVALVLLAALLAGPLATAEAASAADRASRLLPVGGRVRLLAPTAVPLPATNPPGILPRLVNRTGSTYLTGWVSVYGGRERTDPTVAVTLDSSEYPTIDLPASVSHATTVQGKPARIGRLHGRWILTWSPYQRGEEQTGAALIARGMTAHQAATLARRTRVDERLGRIALDAPPTGLAHLADGPVSLAALSEPCQGGLGPVTSIRWGPRADLYGVGDPEICVRAWKANDGLDVVLRTSLAGPDTVIRGRDGVAGTLGYVGPAGTGDIAARTWREDGTSLLVTARGVTSGELDRFIASMRPGTDSEWQRLIREATIPPPPERTPDRRSLTGSFETGWWRYAIERTQASDGRVFLSGIASIFQVDGQGVGGGSGGPGRPLWVGATWTGPTGTLLHAVVDLSATRLVLTFPSGRRASVPLTDLGARFGVKVYALWYRGSVDIAAADSYAADGRRLAHLAQGRRFPHTAPGGGYEFG